MSEYREEIERGKNWARRRHHVFDYFKPPEEFRNRESAAGLTVQEGVEAAKAAKKGAGQKKKRAGGTRGKGSEADG